MCVYICVCTVDVYPTKVLFNFKLKFLIYFMIVSYGLKYNM